MDISEVSTLELELQQELHLCGDDIRQRREIAPLGLWLLFEIIVEAARIIGSAVLNPPGRDASGRAEKRMTAAWLAGFNRRKWIGVHQEYGLGFTKMAIESIKERQCRGSTHKGEMLVGQHGEETAVGIGWDFPG